eukprot:488698_1
MMNQLDYDVLSSNSSFIMQGKFTLIFIKETGRIGIVWYILQSICTSHLVTVATPNKIARDKANGFAREAIQNQLITPDMWSNANNTKQKHDPVSFHWDTPHTRSTVQYKQKSTRYSPMWTRYSQRSNQINPHCTKHGLCVFDCLFICGIL